MPGSLRIAVAGTGAFGREHLRILSRMQGVEIAGVADINPAALKDAAERFGAADRDTDSVALIRRVRPDGLVIATPGPTHVALARQAIRAGIPVLVEKPVAMNAAEASSLVEDQAQSGTFVMPGHVLRFSKAYRRFAKIVRSAKIGTILSITARRHRDDSHPIRYADDPVLMTMIHDIDLAIWMTDAVPSEIVAHRSPTGTHRSKTLMTGRANDGTIWRLSTAWTFPATSCPADRIEVIGDVGSVEMEVGATIRSYGANPQTIDISQEDADQALAGELTYFVQCIGSRTSPTVITLAEAVAGLKVADAILASLA